MVSVVYLLTNMNLLIGLSIFFYFNYIMILSNFYPNKIRRKLGKTWEKVAFSILSIFFDKTHLIQILSKYNLDKRTDMDKLIKSAARL